MKGKRLSKHSSSMNKSEPNARSARCSSVMAYGLRKSAVTRDVAEGICAGDN